MTHNFSGCHWVHMNLLISRIFSYLLLSILLPTRSLYKYPISENGKQNYWYLLKVADNRRCSYDVFQRGQELPSRVIFSYQKQSVKVKRWMFQSHFHIRLFYSSMLATICLPIPSQYYQIIPSWYQLAKNSTNFITVSKTYGFTVSYNSAISFLQY